MGPSKEELLTVARGVRAEVEGAADLVSHPGRPPVRTGKRYRNRPMVDQALRYVSTLKLDVVTYECLRLHAWRRKVHIRTMIQDILCCWIALVTDYDQALWQEALPRGVRGGVAPERWAGYLASLGFETPSMRAARPVARAVPEESSRYAVRPLHGVYPDIPPLVEFPPQGGYPSGFEPAAVTGDQPVNTGEPPGVEFLAKDLDAPVRTRLVVPQEPAM